MSLFKCTRCKKEKPREDFDSYQSGFYGDHKLRRKFYCRDCDDGRKRDSMPKFRVKKQYQKSIKEKICPNCGKTFEGGRKKYCNPTCQVEAMEINKLNYKYAKDSSSNY